MRYLEPYIIKDLQRKMVFIGGPRQAGKTTISKHILGVYPYKEGHFGKYLLWDDDEDRSYILKQAWPASTSLVVLDELHKFKRWRNWLKGTFDKQRDDRNFLVTGSARLDLYRRGGDSLLGRYHYWRLHPFTLSELPEGISKEEALARLLSVGGFPEPFIANDLQEARRWRRERLDRVLREDVRELESLQDISSLRLLVDLLRSRVGSSVVMSNLAEDLQIAPATVKRWVGVLSAMYLCFPVFPYSKKIPRAIQRPPKVFFYDNGDVLGDEGAVFENLVATHLLKRNHFLEDSTGTSYELMYLRDKEKREVDFVILKDGQVDELIEVKLTETKPTSALKHYAKLLMPRRTIQIVRDLKQSMLLDGVEIVPAIEELSKAPW
jgi:predicted AAA+ superfamily ATPase